MKSHLVQVVCVHIRGVSAIQGAGLEGFHCICIRTYITMECLYVRIYIVHWTHHTQVSVHSWLSLVYYTQNQIYCTYVRTHVHTYATSITCMCIDMPRLSCLCFLSGHPCY